MARAAGRLLERTAAVKRGVAAYPAATAMVWPGPARAHEAIAVPAVRLGPADVLVRVELATICESDVDVVGAARHPDAPLVLGHEQVGRIVATGGGTPRTVAGERLSVGDRIVWAATVPCGRCTLCRRGFGSKCVRARRYGHQQLHRGWELSGGFATHVQVLAGTPIVTVPEDVPATVLAPASCAAATAVAALDAASRIVPLAGSVVVICGGGQRMLTAVALAHNAGAHVVAASADSRGRDAALRFGAEAVADLCAVERDAPSVHAALLHTAGRAATCRIVIDFTGGSTESQQLWPTIEVGGVFVFVGDSGRRAQPRVTSPELAQRMLTARGVDGYHARHLEAAVRFVTTAGRRYPLAGLIGEVFPLEKVDAALALAATGAVARVGVAP